MSAVSAPFGLRPILHASGQGRSRQYTIASGYITDIFQYSPVILNTNGTVTIGTVAADILGVFAGVSYTDTNQRRQFSKMWPANLVATEIEAWVWLDTPGMEYEIQANGPIPASAVGDQADFVNPGTGQAVIQISTAQISTTLAGVGVQAQLRIIDKGRGVDNDWGDAFTIVRVQIARQQYVANKVAV